MSAERSKDVAEDEGSDVARLRQLIAQECEALRRAMDDFAVVASHESIRRRYLALGEHQQRLGELIGDEQATDVLCETYNRVVQ